MKFFFDFIIRRPFGLFVLGAIFISILASGCSEGVQYTKPVKTDKPSPSARKVPSWLVNLPKQAGRLCAVGQSGPTFYPKDAKKNADEDARSNLAISLSAHIEAIMLIYDTEEDSSVQKAHAVQATTFAADFVLESSEIVSYWIDELGIAPGAQKGYTYSIAWQLRRQLYCI